MINNILNFQPTPSPLPILGREDRDFAICPLPFGQRPNRKISSFIELLYKRIRERSPQDRNRRREPAVDHYLVHRLDKK